MIVLTRSECLAARGVVSSAAEHNTLDAPAAALLLGIIHDTLEDIKLEPATIIVRNA